MSTPVRHVLRGTLMLFLCAHGAAAQGELPQRELTPTETASLRTTSYAVLFARRQARDLETGDPTRRGLRVFRASLVRLRNDLMAARPPVALTITEDLTGSQNPPAVAASQAQSTRQFINRATENLDDLKQRAERRARTSRAEQARKRAKVAARRVHRIAKLQELLQDLEGQSRAEQLEIVNALLARTKVMRRRHFQSISRTGPPGVLVEPSTGKRATPTLSFRPRHRH